MNIKSLFKLYTIPVLALFFGFGLYYAIFVGTNKQKEDSVPEGFNPAVLSQPEINYKKEETKLEDTAISDGTALPQEISSDSSSQNPPSNSSVPKVALASSAPASSSTKDSLAKSSSYIVLGKALNVRKSPDISSEIVGKLIYGQNIEVEFIKNDWAKLKNGWVYARLLKPSVNPSAAPENVSAKPSGNTSPKSSIISENASAKPSEISSSENFAKDIAKSTTKSQPKSPSTGLYSVGKLVNIRLEPTTSSKVVGKLTPNQTIQVKDIQNGWGKIDGGWVFLELLSKKSDESSL